MAQSNKSAGGGSAPGSVDQTGTIATPWGGFRVSDPVADLVVLERGLRIKIPRRGRCVEFMGTRAQLEAAWPLPPTLDWPDRSNRVDWYDCGFNYMLRRQRPTGTKGPWIHIDWWNIRRCNDAEVQERMRLWPWYDEEVSKYRTAERDLRFQAFKALVIGGAA